MTEAQLRLQRHADGLEVAERVGGPDDYPEGTRVVMISDTLVNDLVATIRQCLTDATVAKMRQSPYELDA
jgi:hypothetical protein